MRTLRMVLLIGAVSMGLVACSDEDGATSTLENQTTSTSAVTVTSTTQMSTASTPASAATSTVRVIVKNVESAQGLWLGGVMTKGSAPPTSDEDLVGGVSALVTSDPFSGTMLVRSLPTQEELDPTLPWPYVTGQPAVLVEPGTYYLELRLDTDPPLDPGAEIITPVGASCYLILTVTEGVTADVTVNGFPSRETWTPGGSCPVE